MKVTLCIIAAFCVLEINGHPINGQERMQGCVISDVGAKLLCDAVKNLTLNQPDELRLQYCTCLRAFFSGEKDYCQPDKYDFALSPNCGKLYKSDIFKEFVDLSKNQLAYKMVVKFVGENIGLCGDSQGDHSTITKLAYRFLKSDMMMSAYGTLVGIALSDESAEIFQKCPQEFAELMNAP